MVYACMSNFSGIGMLGYVALDGRNTPNLLYLEIHHSLVAPTSGVETKLNTDAQLHAFPCTPRAGSTSVCHERGRTSHSRCTASRPHYAIARRPSLVADPSTHPVQTLCTGFQLLTWDRAEVICPVENIEPRRRLRSASSADLTVPATRRSTLGDRAFAVAGPRAWNTLSNAIRRCSSPDTFKRSLKTHLYLQSYF